METKSVLVTYATGHGSTGYVAEEIAGAIRSTGVSVDIFHIDTAPSPVLYDAVVIGSPIRFDTWLTSAKAYVATHEKVLASRRVAYFFTCMALSLPDGRKQGQKYAEKIATQNAAVEPVDVGQFAGALNFGNFPWVVRLPARFLLKILGAKSGDFRNRGAIHDWSLRCFKTF